MRTAIPLSLILSCLASGATWAALPDRLACVEVASSDLARAAAAGRIAALEIALRAEAGAATLLCFDEARRSVEAATAGLGRAGVTATGVWPTVVAARLVVVRGVRRGEAAALGRVLAAAGRRALIELAPGRSLDEPWTGSHAVRPGAGPPRRLREAAEPVTPEVTLARRLGGAAPDAPAAGPLTPALEAVVAAQDATRWLADVTTLAGWNRWTRGAQILSARDWLAARFAELRGAEAWTESFPVGANTGWNVFARLPGTVDPASWLLVGGHYDSTSEAPPIAAPGAEDNASGCAGVLELARALAAQPPPRTLLFVCYAGEEQGLYGSDDHASDLVASGGDAGFAGGLVLDMVGYTGDSELDVLLETDASIGGPLVDALATAAADFTTLAVDVSWSPFGSDHVPYLDRGLPAALAIANDWDSYPHYHRTTDLPGALSLAMGGAILRMDAGAIGRLAGLADIPGLLFRDGFERGAPTAWAEIVLEP